MDLLDWAQPKLNEAIQTACDCAHLPLLPQWSSIVLASFAACQLLYAQIGPALTRWLLPKKYPNLTDRKRLDWDIHVVSFTNAAVITYLSTRVVLFDQERKQMTWQQRAWGFTESSAFVLAVANGYFYWHLIMMIRYHRVYGLAMVAHAVSVSFLMTNGFRPAFVTYAPASYLYESSTIFMNVHRALVMFGWEGTKWPTINGIALLSSFFLSRVVWGTYLTAWFYRDIWTTFIAQNQGYLPAHSARLPDWLLASHALSATILQTLNFVWFWKILQTLRRKLLGSGLITQHNGVPLKED